MDPYTLSALIGGVASSAIAWSWMIQQRREFRAGKAAGRTRQVITAAERAVQAREDLHRRLDAQRGQIEKVTGELVDWNKSAEQMLELIDPKPFDPLDPNADRAWCQSCDHIKPAAEFGHPLGLIMWICADCREDYENPEAVLNPPEPEPEPESQPDRVKISEVHHNGDVITVYGSDGPTMFGHTNSREFTCAWCRSSFTSAAPVPTGAVLCRDCTRNLSNSSCHYCKADLVSGYGLKDHKPACEQCLRAPSGVYFTSCADCGERCPTQYGISDGLGDDEVRIVCRNCYRNVGHHPHDKLSDYCELGLCAPCGDLMDEHELAGDTEVPRNALCAKCRRLASGWVSIGLSGASYLDMRAMRQRVNITRQPITPSRSFTHGEQRDLEDELTQRRQKRARRHA